ncbi:MAG: Na+/H+ antiporter subunit E [Clostridiales bacterium]|nr:Na+/H+ antiporter subunit E [Clostridiales bacterium]
MYYIKRIIDPKGFLIITVILLGFWFLMSPTLSVVNIIIGTSCCLGITYFWSPDLFRPGSPMGFTPIQVIKLMGYLVHLGYNILIANFAVAKIVLSPKMPISPGFILLQTKLRKELSRVLYANSITLTPGTITIDLNGDRLLVHAITDEAAEGVANWYMEDKMRGIEVSSKFWSGP